ncbi:protein NatB [Colwellia sp. PAMC 20917]|jgi:sodium transport system permease protein|uniref:ABC transporter permease n=1 Tax=unclassified Colwellia TaxID=196834 RepID=UPI000878C530|nr:MULTISPECIES: ABC transporter permease [unclassified Colwellia]MBA6363510.1 ABC transporter permease [Colwellia sp. BRX8-8]AOW77803.1 protein NatB [Colwellia sp. PAMC 20917]MBA6339027.1 ABC transporter permease [Colwellia sp. BRX8-7]MBA6350197.1 ABC transporter permease [Colwellia sp. BRX8-9]MBA6351719.1 ABC transporter permease [Colwellia sp. BRX9-1]|tara:strand:+ start:2501 stop:3664 length:1164 start_codon:yes stop_codon:yes gene_type:complete
MIQFKALLIKELREAFRDKRALMVALSMGLFAPIMIMVISKTMIKEIVDNPPIYVQFTGAEFAPKLIEKFAVNNILQFADVPEEEKYAWQERNIEVDIPKDFAEKMLAGQAIDVVLRADFGKKASSAPIRRVKEVVREYSLAIGYKRLLVRGVDINLLQPIVLQEQDTALPTSNAVMVSMFLGIYLLMGAFVSGLSIAIDSSAGERERNVLEMLLCQPVSTLKIVLAKMTCASSISVLSIVIMLVLTTVSVGFIDLTKIGATFSLNAFSIAALLLLLIPLCFFATALQLFFSFQAKSFKEAQSTVSMLIMLPAMVPFAIMMIDDKPEWVNWLPISGQSMLMEDVFKGLPVDWTVLASTTAITVGMTVALVLALAQKLKSEKVVMSLS